MTANVMAMITSRPGNGRPAAVRGGSAAAKMSESPPRRPAQEMTTGTCHGGEGSRWRTRRLRRRGR